MLVDTIKLRYRRLRISHSLHRNDALGALHRAWAYVHATMLAGDYYEFGVYQGTSLLNSWFSQQYFRRRLALADNLPFQRVDSVARFIDVTPVFHGLDTFEGMPPNQEGEASLAQGSFNASLDYVARRCARQGLGAPTLRLIKGKFSETRTEIGDRKAAIVHIDCDLYASARDALMAAAPLLTQGSILLFDDYNLFRADSGRGERRALAEFLEQGTIAVEPWFAYGPAAQAFICHV